MLYSLCELTVFDKTVKELPLNDLVIVNDHMFNKDHFAIYSYTDRGRYSNGKNFGNLSELFYLNETDPEIHSEPLNTPNMQPIDFEHFNALYVAYILSNDKTDWFNVENWTCKYTKEIMSKNLVVPSDVIIKWLKLMEDTETQQHLTSLRNKNRDRMLRDESHIFLKEKFMKTLDKPLNSYTKKEPFYIFTDIKGVLSDQEKTLQVYGPYMERAKFPIIEKDSVCALNNLLSSLEEIYDTRLIITSKLRQFLPTCIEFLNKNGLSYDKPIYSTEFKEGLRSEKIFDVMQKEGHSPERRKNLRQLVSSMLHKAISDKSFKNYVVIDSSDTLKKYIPKSHLIKTNAQGSPLKQSQVTQFLESIYPEERIK